MNDVREALTREDLEHLLRGGTLAISIPPEKMGRCQSVAIHLPVADTQEQAGQTLVVGRDRYAFGGD